MRDEIASSSSQISLLGSCDGRSVVQMKSPNVAGPLAVSSLPMSTSPSTIKISHESPQYCPSPNMHPLKSPPSKSSPLSIFSPSFLKRSLFAPEEKMSGNDVSTCTRSDIRGDRLSLDSQKVHIKSDKFVQLQPVTTSSACPILDPSFGADKGRDCEIYQTDFSFNKLAYAKLPLLERLASQNYSPTSSSYSTSSNSTFSSSSSDSANNEGCTVENDHARKYRMEHLHKSFFKHHSSCNSYDSCDNDTDMPRGVMLSRRVKAVAALLDGTSNKTSLSSLTETKCLLQSAYESTLKNYRHNDIITRKGSNNNGDSGRAGKNNSEIICDNRWESYSLVRSNHNVVSIDNNDAAASLLTMASGFHTYPSKDQNITIASSNNDAIPVDTKDTSQNKNHSQIKTMDYTFEKKRKNDFLNIRSILKEAKFN